jgi:hypothetical protein
MCKGENHGELVCNLENLFFNWHGVFLLSSAEFCSANKKTPDLSYQLIMRTAAYLTFKSSRQLMISVSQNLKIPPTYTLLSNIPISHMTIPFLIIL